VGVLAIPWSLAGLGVLVCRAQRPRDDFRVCAEAPGAGSHLRWVDAWSRGCALARRCGWGFPPADAPRSSACPERGFALLCECSGVAMPDRPVPLSRRRQLRRAGPRAWSWRAGPLVRWAAGLACGSTATTSSLPVCPDNRCAVKSIRRDVDVCLLVDGAGIAGKPAADVWAGIQDASCATSARVSYIRFLERPLWRRFCACAARRLIHGRLVDSRRRGE
jgi:hypothetical protein